MRKRLIHHVSGTVLLLVGCGDDAGYTVEPTGTTEGSGGVTFGSGSDDDSEGGEPAGCAEYPLPFPMEGVFTAYRENDGAAVEDVIPGEAGNQDDICPNSATLPASTASSFYVYRPTAGGGSWPGGAEQQYPLVIFSPPNGGAPVDASTGKHLYPWLETLAAEGFIVVAINASLGQRMDARALYVQCAMEWARTQWEHAERVNCDLSLIGHSRGGGAVHALAAPFVTADVGLRAVVGIAPAESSGDQGDIEAEPIHPSLAVPYLVLGGGNDDDPTGHFSRMYDMMGFEDPPGVMSRADKAGFYLYDARHFVYGGRDPELLVEPPDNYEEIDIVRGQAVAGAYVSRFLRWQVYGESQHRGAFVAPTGHVAGVAAFPDEILEGEVDAQVVDLWEPLYSQAPYAVLGERPVMLPMFSQGSDPQVPGLGPPERHRLRIDTMHRSPAPACGHQDQPLILSPSSPLEAEVSRVGLASGDVCLAEGVDQLLADHDTHTMRIDWGQASFGQGIRWAVTEDLEAYSHLSVRLAKRRTGMGTNDPLSVRFEIETEAIDDDGTFPVSASIDYNRVLNTDLTAGFSALSMHTVRVPFGGFMSVQPLDFARPRSISLLVPDTQNGGAFLYADSLEVTRHPQDAGAFAPTPGAYWACEADGRLTVVEHACAEAPAEGNCPVQSEISTPLDLPHVDLGGGWDGWILDTIPGWLESPNAPTQSDLERLALRCETACRRHYQGHPSEVVAQCDAENFVTPYQVMASDSRTRRSIPDAQRDGSGLIDSASLSCDLLDSCWCDHFVSPEICAGAPMRVTTAQSELGRGEQWVVEVAGTVTAESIEDETDGEAELVGTVGISLCEGGSLTTPCPYHLGSVHLETTEPLELELDCNGQPVVHTIDSLSVDLVQPAMGIAYDASLAFPSGSVVLRTTATSGQSVYVTERPNEQPYLYAGQMLQSQGQYWFEVTLGVMCGGEVKPVKAELAFDIEEIVHSPPSLTIDVPNEVLCPYWVDLEDEVTVVDTEDDLASVRWRIHGHLIGENVSQVLVWAYDLEVTACDERGACTRAEKTLSCIPLPP